MRIGFSKEKANNVINKVLKMKRAEDMDDYEIREHLIKLEDWKSDDRDIVSSKEKVLEDAVRTTIENKEVLDLQTVVQAAVNALEAKMENLKLVDMERCMFSSSKTI